MIRRALLAVAFVAAGWGAPEAVGAAARTPRPTPETSLTVRRLSDASSSSLGSVITEPGRIHQAVLDGLPAHEDLLGERGAALVELRDRIESERLRVEWAAAEQLLRTRTVKLAATNAQTERGDLAIAAGIRTQSEENLLQMSVDAFITGSDQPDLASVLSASNDKATTRATEELRTTRLAAAATDDLVGHRDQAIADEAAQQRQLDEALARLDREEQLLGSARSIHAEAEAELAELEPQVGPSERRFERELLTKTLPGTNNLQIVAIDAYYNASEIAFDRWPACRVAWHQLAGVGRVESFHGNFGSSRVDRNGQTSPKILGPQLNGDPWLAIPDTDAGVLDDDLEWDRAVGPMQFIPSSWAIFAADGNGDGAQDPHNLYDATVAAADHLCGQGLDDPDRFRQALLGYNRSVSYGYDVMDFGSVYEAATDIANPWDEPAEPLP